MVFLSLMPFSIEWTVPKMVVESKTFSLLVIPSVWTFSRAQQGRLMSAVCALRWGEPGSFVPSLVPQLEWLGYLEDGQVSLSRRVVEPLFRVARGSRGGKMEAARCLEA